MFGVTGRVSKTTLRGLGENLNLNIACLLSERHPPPQPTLHPRLCLTFGILRTVNAPTHQSLPSTLLRLQWYFTRHHPSHLKTHTLTHLCCYGTLCAVWTNSINLTLIHFFLSKYFICNTYREQRRRTNYGTSATLSAYTSQLRQKGRAGQKTQVVKRQNIRRHRCSLMMMT